MGLLHHYIYTLWKFHCMSAICFLHVGTCCYVESTQRIDVSHQIIKNVNHRRQLLHGYILTKKIEIYYFIDKYKIENRRRCRLKKQLYRRSYKPGLGSDRQTCKASSLLF